MIELTVALPCFNADKIGWLALESLCRQDNINFEWELIVCEEKHNNMLGWEFFLNYKERLKEVGCVNLKYISLSEWVNLPKKWQLIGEAMANSSKVFMLQAVDCYAQPNRLKQTYDEMTANDLDWLDFDKGYFYSFVHKKTILYNGGYTTNLDMAMKSSHARKIPDSNLNKGIDKLLYAHCNSSSSDFKRKTIKGIRGAGVDTDGYNNISKKRVKFYHRTTSPFINCSVGIDKIGMPSDILERIKTL